MPRKKSRYPKKSYYGIQELITIEAGLKNYSNDIVRKFAKGFGLNENKELNITILDFGSGLGTLAEIWKIEFGITPVCIEVDPKLISNLRAKGFDTYLNLAQILDKQDIIYSSNVLEHIEDDLGTLKALKNCVAPGGYLGLYVPALPFLFSDLDVSVGHFRRYKRKELIKKVEEAGFSVQACFYNDCIGVLAALAIRIFGYKNNMKLGSMGSIIFYDKLIYPISRVLDKIVFRNLIGKNLFLFAINTAKP